MPLAVYRHFFMTERENNHYYTFKIEVQFLGVENRHPSL